MCVLNILSELTQEITVQIFSVGWAGFDDYELLPNQENCNIKPPEATPHEPSEGDCIFQHSLCDWELVPPPEGGDDLFQFIRTNFNKSVITGPEYDHFGDKFGYFLIAYGELGE